MIQIRYTSILLWSVHDKAARAAHLPVRRLSSLLPRVLAGRGNLLASLLPPVLEDLAPCGRPLTNPEARRSLPVLAGRGNLLASLLPPVLEDLAPCGRPLTNPEAR